MARANSILKTRLCKDRHNKYISTADGISLAERLRFCGFAEKAEI